MSWHRSGVTNVQCGTLPAVMSPAMFESGLIWLEQTVFDLLGGLPDTSWKKTKGSCLAA